MEKQNRKHLFIRRLTFAVLLVSGAICCFTFFNTVPQSIELVPLAATTKAEAAQPETRVGKEASQMPSKTDTRLTQSNQSVNPVTQAVVKLGIFSSLKRIDQVASFLTKGNKTGVYIFTPQDPPDRHVLSTSFELIRPDQTNLYASASFFPNNDAVYETVEYVQMSCQKVQDELFKHLKYKKVLKGSIVMLDAGPMKVFLMPAGKGTVIIKKEVVK